MTPEQKKKIAKGISVLVGIAGMIVITGWIFNIGFLKSLSPAWISMKFDTALTFVLSSVVLYFIAQAREGGSDAAQVVLPVTALVILLLMGILFFSDIFGVHTGLEQLFIRYTNAAPRTVIPGLPSLPTMLNFILIASAAVYPEKMTLPLKITGLIVGTVGIVAIVGYLVNAPFLYYFVAGANAAMACYTAILFVFLGIGFLCL